MLRIMLLGVCLCVATAALAQDKATIAKLNDAWAAAFNKGDAQAVAAMYAEDAYVLPPGSDIVKGRAAIEATCSSHRRSRSWSSIASACR